MSNKGNYIKRIQIDALWSRRRGIDWTLRPDVNILSGVNGVGKSTILNRVVRQLIGIDRLEKQMEGVTLTFTGTVREKVIPSGTLQYLAIKFKLNNESKKNVTISENNFKTNLNGKWEFPIASDKLSDSQKQFLFEKADAPYIDYYAEGGDPFGTADTELEAAICYMTKSTESKMDLMVTYGAKVFKVTLDI